MTIICPYQKERNLAQLQINAKMTIKPSLKTCIAQYFNPNNLSSQKKEPKTKNKT